MAQSSTITTANYHTDVDAIRSNLQTHIGVNKLGRQKTIAFLGHAIVNTTAIEDRSRVWVPTDDAVIRCLIVEGLGNTSTQTGKAKLEAITDGGVSIARRLPGGALEVEDATMGTGATSSERTIYGTDTPAVPGLLAGTPYRLSVEVTTSGGGTCDVLRAYLVYHVLARR